jgi:hypothetical protein
MMNVRVSEKVVKHVVKGHRDWVEMLGLSSEEVRDFHSLGAVSTR